jgi:predicted transcriptional regulator of viral defense system
MSLRVTGLERTLVDVLDRPHHSGDWEEVWRSLESVEFFNVEEVVEYALLLGNATTIAKVGLFLDLNRETLMVEDHHLQALRDRRPVQPHYANRGSRGNGTLVADWNLLVPAEVLTRSWDEVA